LNMGLKTKCARSSTSAAYGLAGQGQAVNNHRTTTEQWRTAEPIHIEYPLVGEERLDRL